MKKIILPLLLISSFCITSCNKHYEMNEQVTYTANPVIAKNNMPVSLFNSDISISTYNKDYLNEISPLFQETVQSIHKDSDRYNYYEDEKGNLINNLRVVNESYGTNKAIKVSDNLFELLDLSLKLHELSEGYFNPTMGSLIDLWDKTIPSIPGYGVLDIVDTPSFNEAKSQMIPYSVIEEERLKNYIVLDSANKTVTFKKYKDINKITISLGGIAKGYGMYKVEELFKDEKYPIMIDGGQSSLALLNDHPQNKTYKIGVASPYSSGPSPIFGQKLLYVLDLKAGTNISTSGDYLHYAYITDKKCDKNDPIPCQRLKEDLGDGKFRFIRRHHILNPFKGHSENYYRVINLNADGRADVLDALSTILFNINIETDKEKFIRIINNFEKEFNIKIDYLLESEFSFINEQGKEWSNLNVYMSEGMNNSIYRDYDTKVDFINKEIIVK